MHRCFLPTFALVCALLGMPGSAASAWATNAPACAPAAPRVPQPPAVNVPQDAAAVDVIIDPRIELMTIVQYLSGDYEQRTNLITNFDFEYKREIEQHFRPFADHPAVAAFSAMARKGFSFDACPLAFLHLSADAELKVRAPLPENLLKRLERAGSVQQFEKFRAQLADFAKVSGYFDFFAQHEDLFSQFTMIVRKGLRPDAVVSTLNQYTGMQVRNAHLVLFPMGHPGGFAAQVNRPAPADDQPGALEVYALIGPGGAIDDRPTWSTLPWTESLIIHEFSHTIVNPIAAEHAERIARSAHRLEPMKQQMSRQAYQSWETVVNEHIVRALEVRIALQRHGEEAAQRKQAEEVKRGFAFVPDLVAALERYEQDRDRWPTLQEFFPELLAVFEKE